MLEGTSDIAVVGNVFAGLADRAIAATGECRRIAVVGNVVTDIGRRRGETFSAFELGTVQETVAGLNAVEKKFEGK